MSKQGFFPHSVAKRITWISNYMTKLLTLGPLCGISAAEIATMLADLQAYIWVHQNWYPATQQQAVAATSFKDQFDGGSDSAALTLPVMPTFPDAPPLGLPGVLTRLFGQIAGIKIHPAYTESMGLELGIIGMADTADHEIPQCSASVEQGDNGQQVRIGFHKYNHDGVSIESRRAGGDWEFLAVNNTRFHLDQRPLLVAGVPEYREYRLRYWDKAQAHGEYSAVQSGTVGM